MADFLAVIVLAVAVLMIIASYRVIVKMGFPGWYVAVLLIPVAGQFFFLYLAFAEWPIEREMTQLRYHARMVEKNARANQEVPPLPGQMVAPQGFGVDGPPQHPEQAPPQNITPTS